MKAILMSIRPEWVAKILNGEKTIEIRKKFPKDYVGWVYIYCTKDKNNLLHKNCAGIWWVEDKDFQKKNKRLGIEQQPIYNGKVVARFWCDKVEEILARKNKKWYHLADTIPMCDGDIYHICQKSCLSQDELHNYLKSKRGRAIHIIKVEPFDKPKEISEFYGYDSKYKKMIKKYPYQKSWWLTLLTRAPQSWQYIEV